MNVSRETAARYDAFCALLRKWNSHINLVGPSTLDDAMQRHIADSLCLVPLIPSYGGVTVDLGSGAGFPGLVVAAERPDTRVTLVESDQRKSIFLAEAARLMGVTVTVIADRIERIAPLGAQTVTARALAPLHKLLDYQRLHGDALATGLYLKGANHLAEVDEARKKGWQFDLCIHRGNALGSVVLQVSSLVRS